MLGAGNRGIAMDLLDSIDAYFGWPRPDRKGERWTLCQGPNHQDRHVGSFSYGENGYNCYSCGFRGSLRRLAEYLGIIGVDAAPEYHPRSAAGGSASGRPRPRPAAPPAPPRPWQTDPGILERFQPIPRLGLDYAYSRGLSDSSIERWRIGWGVLPSSRARLPRLILPVIEGGQVVGLRGRAVHPDDDAPKWLVAAGSKTTLFGAESLAVGANVIVTEAPLACILVAQEYPEYVAVASTAGCGAWRDEWTEAIRAGHPRKVRVQMDNDAAGHAAALKVGNALAAAHVPVEVYPWPKGLPPKYDLADLIVNKIRARAVVPEVVPEADSPWRTDPPGRTA